ncbi:MAG: radical SAM protein [Candidatus Pacebacteria bacterium]|nr:radical SAM protein [Candidatus Paceibacterota bacterium]MCF7857528.1 radical SAM protein [Candidatus Paceibacterota bacterium]
MAKTRSTRISPNTFWLNVTDFCNNKCVWCYEKEMNDHHQKIPISLAKQIIFTMSRVGATECLLIGGEPTLHDDLPSIVSFVKETGMRAVLITNGRKLAKRDVVESLRISSVDSINVSVHGWDAVSYLQLTGASKGFSEMAQGISNVRESGIDIAASFVLSRHVIGHMESIVESIAKLGFSRVEYNMGSPSVGKDAIDGSFLIPIDMQKEIVLEACRLSVEYGVFPGFNLNIPHCLFSQDEFKILNEHAYISSGCTIRSGSGVIYKIDGSLAVCNHLLDFPVAAGLDAGKLLDSGKFSSFWNSVSMAAVREEITCYHHESCAVCPHWEACAGGCPINWMYFNPDEVDLHPIGVV